MDKMSIYKGEVYMNLREALKNSKLTLKEISEKAEIKYDTLLRYSSGKRNLPIKKAKILGEILKINWWEFFEN